MLGDDMDNQVINNIKSLGIDMINEVKSGHPGIVLGAAPILYTLYKNHLNINPSDPNWFNRDRFVMSAGHGSALLYSVLFMAGYLELEDLKQFRKIHSRTPGHPELGITPGVDISTGPLGQGFASAVGMAIASKKLNQELRFPKKSFLEAESSLIDHKVYVLCSDGDMMEGITSEAASIAGNLKLNNLIVLYDSNHISLDGTTKFTLKENILKKFEAMNWNTIYVKNGNDVSHINRAITKAKSSSKPTIIELNTIIGEGTELEGTSQIHGKPLSNVAIENLKTKLNIPNTPFYVNSETREYFQQKIATHVNNAYTIWSEHYNTFMNQTNHEAYNFLFGKENSFNLLNYEFHFDFEKEATRVTNHEIMKVITQNLPNFIGGSADLSSATGTYLEEQKDITDQDYSGKNILFGVREQAMGAILNGISTYHYRTFGSTFLSFSDYMKPSIRMSALMKLPVTYIFSHDSINIGEDGPTHQPIEQLASLRATPNLNVYRPCDANELIGSWNTILKEQSTPNALILSRVDVPNLNISKKELVEKGAYIIFSERNQLQAILIATGTEVHTAIHIAYDLYQTYHIGIRVVSMPCMEKFLEQSKEYQEDILPTGYKKIVIESGSSFGWEKFVYNEKYLICLQNFGFSGSKDEVLKEMNFDYETIKNRVVNLLR
ncbi:transketolase [bacterium]|nr:transketolase [bacterium]